MANNCVNISHPDFKALVSELGIEGQDELIKNLAAKVSIWQDANLKGDQIPSSVALNQDNIRPDVLQLFESNPELANAVYETLGFTNRLKVSLGKELEYKDPYAKNRIKAFKKYEVLDENGKNIGTVTIEDRGNKTVILHPELSVIGKGYGKDLYKFISSTLGVTIQEWNEGTISKSSSAKKMWNSLEKEGSAVRIFDEKQGDNFRQLNYKSGITPQQKQQAQQLYSQYLNNVFPDSKVKEIDNTLYNSILNQLEQENKIEKDCTGGKLKAKDGLRTKFTKGSHWEIVKDLKGYPSHAQGGVDVKLGKNGFSFTRDNSVIAAKCGLVIPKIK